VANLPIFAGHHGAGLQRYAALCRAETTMPNEDLGSVDVFLSCLMHMSCVSYCVLNIHRCVIYIYILYVCICWFLYSWFKFICYCIMYLINLFTLDIYEFIYLKYYIFIYLLTRIYVLKAYAWQRVIYLYIWLVFIFMYSFCIHLLVCVCVFSLYAFMFTFCTKSFLIPCIYIRIYAWLHDFVMSGYVWPLPFWLCHFQWWWRPKHQVLGFWSWTPATMLGRSWWIGLVGAVSIGFNHGLSIGHLWISQAFFCSVFSPVKMSRQETSLVAVQCSPRMGFSCWIEDMARLNIQAPTLHWKVDDLGMAENTASNNE